MTLTTALLFSIVALAAIATPGPTVLLALSNGSRRGVRGALPGMFGAMLSDFVLVGAVALGLGALLAASEFWFSMLKWVGAAYLAWLGIRMLRSKGGSFERPAEGAAAAPGSGRQVFLKSFLVAVTNPKGYLFCSALLPQFIDPAASQGMQYAIIAVLFAGLDMAVMLVYAFVGAKAMQLLTARAARWIDRTCGAMLLALAGSLAFYRRATP
ncbi:amino acid transporter [Variovorax paradoxus]|jgi:threonine/homoserine/homoserine lactone efflux protein|uniref:LysE family translocator n=1 Tax=Variovorax TaxID=34072 RepID=UPI0006E571B3|nr:amino acid transporter [Variovorax paradoxus]KPV03862.1 amino acid transporter [Variovorax paradoxus]KPV08257.1 amino acid transporter [Variovorax paradoxus]KPV16042.1 amino acid transporter [Variovorax paradoxus]KPV26690.1 amino acid transporter [Variovorax paradoxus]